MILVVFLAFVYALCSMCRLWFRAFKSGARKEDYFRAVHSMLTLAASILFSYLGGM